MVASGSMSKEKDKIIALAIASEVKSLRVKSEWTQRELSARANIPSATIARIELGYLPTSANIFRLSDAFNKSPDHFKKVADTALAMAPT